MEGGGGPALTPYASNTPAQYGGKTDKLLRKLHKCTALFAKYYVQSCYIEIEQGFTRFTFSAAISKPLELKRSYIPL